MTDILILGAGEVGQAALDYTCRLDRAETVTVADLDEDRAAKAAAPFGKARAEAVDVTDAANLRALMERHDAVLNTVGPFFRFAKPVLDAALDTRTLYLDVADDWEPTLELLGCDKRARQAGVTAVVGMGASPGLANLLARAAMEDRPGAYELFTAWRADDVGTGYSAAKEHWLHQCTGTIRVLRDGEMVDEPPLRAIPIEYPGIGTLELISVGHPEAVTLPRRYRDLKTCLNAMVLPPKLLELLRTHYEENPEDLKASATSFNERYAAMGKDDLSIFEHIEGLFAVARDDAGSTIVTLLAYPEGLGPVTSAPLVTALDLILDGRGPGPGVWTPEDAFAPDVFFARFAEAIGTDAPITKVSHS